MNVGKIKKVLFEAAKDPSARFAYLSKLGLYNWMSDAKYLKRKYKSVFGRELDLEHPKTYNEKLQWLKLNNRKPEYTKMVDKYLVRQYVAEVIGAEHLIPLLGVWDSPDEIDFDQLPNQFVLKCNHNSGLGMCICKDKSQLNLPAVRAALQKGLKENYYIRHREWPYKNVPRKIIAEQFMDDGSGDLRDYKFYCFDGVMRFLMINSDRNSDQPTKADYFDRDFNWLDFQWGYDHADPPPSKPENLELMIDIAERLSKGMPHVRVDLYDCNGQIYFGELTFFDGSGFDKIEPVEWDYKIGEMLVLPDGTQ